ncbi:hypothetical protein STRIP9103_09155 [Streptomyces ipomoeae 91-03]|uniref:Uncharacterized protein n=1 Tax=Streptomyces ipomoeae 91-03 TaxID=698759 RepID=L1KLP0_9ACTN|nr:hypothetical protein STRIP9103_09155 [Streptomyces ipomoeae 91-03]
MSGPGRSPSAIACSCCPRAAFRADVRVDAMGRLVGDPCRFRDEWPGPFGPRSAE